MKKFLTVFLVTLLAGSMAFAADVVIPGWRGDPGSTYQRWEFSTDNPFPVPDVVNNPYGTPLLKVNTPFSWDNGAWPLSGEIDILIPNYPQIRPEKWIQIQLTWQPAGLDPDPFLADQPLIAVTPFDGMEMYRYDDDQVAPGWIHSTFDITIWPNPYEEWFTIKGDILVDELVIDTICIPEPMTVTLLGLGGLALMRKRRV